jgi:hypothetical protein
MSMINLLPRIYSDNPRGFPLPIDKREEVGLSSKKMEPSAWNRIWGLLSYKAEVVDSSNPLAPRSFSQYTNYIKK